MEAKTTVTTTMTRAEAESIVIALKSAIPQAEKEHPEATTFIANLKETRSALMKSIGYSGD